MKGKLNEVKDYLMLGIFYVLLVIIVGLFVVVVVKLIGIIGGVINLDVYVDVSGFYYYVYLF